jgi:hypothetical protein
MPAGGSALGRAGIVLAESIYKKAHGLFKVQFMTSIKLLHVLATGKLS